MRKLYASRILSFPKNLCNRKSAVVLSLVASILSLMPVSSLQAQQAPVENLQTEARKIESLRIRRVSPGADRTAGHVSPEVEMRRELDKQKAVKEGQYVHQDSPARTSAGSPSRDAILNFPGTLTLAEPTFNRPLSMAQGGTCTLSGVGTAVHYRTHSFTTTTAGNVLVSIDPADGASISPGTADTFLALYGPGGFNPASPCTNLIAADDDGGAGFLSRIQTTIALAPGNYTAVFTSFDNSPSDFPWTYTLRVVTPDPSAPVNDNCANAIALACGGSASGSTATATQDGPGTSCTGGTVAPDVWYTVTGTGSNITASLCGSGYDTKLDIYTGSCGALTSVVCNDDFCGLQSQVSWASTLGVTYYIRVHGFFGATGSFTLNISCPPPNDLCTNATNINCGQSINGTNVGATADVAPTCTGTTNPGVWYTFVGTGLSETLSTCTAASFDTKISVYTGTCGSLTCVTGNDDFCGTRSQVTFTSTLGVTYYVLVHGFASATGTFTLTRSCPCSGVPSPGFITPTSSSVCVGTPVVLTLNNFPLATGITFQWKESTTPGGTYTNIPGATNSTYAFNAAATRYYVCTVTCTNPGGGAATTAEVVVNVGNPQHSSITATPNNNICTPGTSVITATATGGLGNYTHTLVGPGTISAPVVSGPNNSTVTFTVTNIPAGVNNYTLTSTDGIGCSKASVVSVTVNQTPLITLTTTPPVGPCVYTYNGSPVPIPDNNTAGVNIPITVNGLAGLITDLNFRLVSNPAGTCDNTIGNTNASVDHTFNGDLVFTLRSPGGTTVTLINRRGGGGNNFCSVLLDDDGGFPATSTMSTAGAINGNFAPENPLSAFDGQNGNGIWILNVSDRAGIDVGSVRGFALEFECNANNAICNGTIVRIDATAVPPAQQSFTNTNNTHVPAGGTTSGVASPYPNTLNISGLPATGVTVKSVSINGYSHSFPDDVDLVLVSPSGQSVILMSDAGGATDATGQNFTFDDAAAATLADAAFNASGTYRPTNFGAGDTWPAPGPGGSPSSTTLSSFTGNPNGNWNLYAVDDLTGDVGFIATWSITFNVVQPVVFSPLTNLFSDAAATIPYTGTPTYTVWARPNVTTTYTAGITIGGCTNTASVQINVNQLPAITSQPANQAAPSCPGFNVSYTVGATGTGLTYQWQRSTDGGTTWVNVLNDALHSGANTATITVNNPQVGQNGHRYRVIVSGTCPPPVTSSVVILAIAQPPTITTQPVSRTVCAPDAAVFSVVAAGNPTPNIFQWQVSTNGGGSWTNLTTGGSYTTTLTVSPTATSQSGSLYRVIVTNSCGQSVTSSNATLTVNAPTPVTIAPLPTRICLSDTLVNLNATPVGGSWSGTGISGFNFVPSATAVGNYTLTYTYVNALGCTSTGTVQAPVVDCPERIRQLDDNAIILFPNPNNGRFNIRINSVLYNFLGMNVYNTAGQLLHRQTFNGLTYGRVIPIDLNFLPAGPYMVKFFYDDGIRTSEKTFPVIIQRQ